MIDSKSVIVTIGKDGTTRVEANNFHGKGCEAVVEAFSSALGTTTSEGHKHEIFEEDETATITQYE